VSIPDNREATRADDSLIARVRKLLDKAAATSNEHEAEAFSRKAAELIARHRIDPTELARLRTSGDLAVRNIPIGRGAYVRARLSLLIAVADLHDARVVFVAGPTGTIAHVAGYTDDLDVIEAMYHSLHAQAAAQMASVRRSTAAATQRFRRSFLFGFAARLAMIFDEAQSQAMNAAAASSAGTTQLALRQRSERVEEYAGRTFGRVRAAASPAPAQVNGWRAGEAAADRADVGRARLAGRRAIGPSGR
jgi:hypothetical protein